MLSIFKEERDSEGRAVVEIGMNPMPVLVASVSALCIGVAAYYFTAGRGPMGMPWYVFAVPIIAVAIAYPALGWVSRRTRVRITIDAKAGKLLVATSAGQSEVRMADTAKAEFGATSDGDRGVHYRLEFAMKNGERVPASTMYTSAYSPGDREKTVAVINAALGRQMV